MTLDPTAFRGLFPALGHGTFMNVAQRGLMAAPVRAAIDGYLDVRMGYAWDKQGLFERTESTRARFARLIGADSPDEVAFAKNVSDGINMIAGAVDWQPGDNVVLCPELEHPANVFPWYNVRHRHGVEVRTVAPVGGRIPVEDMLARIDARTRLLTVPTVSFSPGFVTDVRALSAVCRERGVFLLVDAAQSVGILHTDVRDLGVDALAVATQKGLMACYGMGFLYCRAEAAERLAPAALARFGVDLPEDAHETELVDQDFRYARGARRFDVGNYNYLGVIAAEAALALLEEIGTRTIEAHVRDLARALAVGLLDLDLPVVGGAPEPDLGHIVAVGVSGGGRHDTVDDPRMQALYDHLSARDVHFSVRKGVLRFSLHGYNDHADVERVVELASEWTRTS
ncbi:MAG: aminotransferase class V-fold PLP-dependent enzyme [Gemmatimonadetes bacterium]|nr:aminotransferase class V-fold PLP-dependent enzyme [Gemmatimonadota bacterium]